MQDPDIASLPLQLANDGYDASEPAFAALLDGTNPVGIVEMDECQAFRIA